MIPAPRNEPHMQRAATKPWTTVPARVRKVFKSARPSQPEKVEILIEAGDELFREIRIENTFNNVDGRTVSLIDGARLDVTFEAESKETITRQTNPSV